MAGLNRVYLAAGCLHFRIQVVPMLSTTDLRLPLSWQQETAFLSWRGREILLEESI